MSAAATCLGAGATDFGSWREAAACRGTKLSWFYGGRAERAHGRARCVVCPVAEACFWFALMVEEEVGYHYGIWGGTAAVTRARVAALIGPGYARDRLVAVLDTDGGQQRRQPDTRDDLR
jgi:hypothetical protein